MKWTLKLVFIISFGQLHFPVSAETFQKEAIHPIVKQQTSSDKANLGKSLFVNPILSASQDKSCQSCHQPEHAYAQPNSTDLQTQSLLNVELMNRYFWDGRAYSLKEAIAISLTSDSMMGRQAPETVMNRLKSDKQIVKAFENIYDVGLTQASLIDALYEYLLTLSSPNSPFDKYLLGDVNAINEDEKKGYELFQSYGCISCHQGVNIGGNLLQKFGIYHNPITRPMDFDLGLYNTTQIEDDKFVFRVPSLRNVALSAPYFHNGSAKTLTQAIEVMGKVQLNQTIPKAHIKQIEAFLNTLTGEWEHD